MEPGFERLFTCSWFPHRLGRLPLDGRQFFITVFFPPVGVKSPFRNALAASPRGLNGQAANRHILRAWARHCYIVRAALDSCPLIHPAMRISLLDDVRFYSRLQTTPKFAIRQREKLSIFRETILTECLMGCTLCQLAVRHAP